MVSGIRVLVTGGSGFIGRHCIEALLARDCEVHAVSRRTPAWNAARLTWHQADLLQPRVFSRLLAECHPAHLIHSAWNTSPDYWTSATNLTWAARSIELLQEAQTYGVVRIVGIGTCAEYGLDHDICDERTTTMQPIGIYALTKYATQLLFNGTSGFEGHSVAWARLFFPYGMYDRPNKLIPYTIHQLLNGKPAMFSSGKQVRDLLFAPDAGEAIVALLFSTASGPVNIGSGIGVPVRDVALRIGELMGHPDLIRLGTRPTHELEAKRWVAAVERLNHEVGWCAVTSLEDGLRATIAAYARQHAAPPP